MKKINHKERWELILSIGKKEAAAQLGLKLQALNSTVKKYKNWAPEIPFEGSSSTPVLVTEVTVTPVDEIEVKLTGIASTEVKTTGDIVRYTNEDDDSRFYWHKKKINERTGNHFFPSFSFLMSLGAPSNPNLTKWYKDQGHNADRIFKQREKEGSYVHDRCDAMVSKGEEVSTEEIDKIFGDSAKSIKDSLLGFINFWEEQQPQVIGTEEPLISSDFGGTTDLRCKIKEDNYTKTWMIDYKTSKSIYDHHRLQLCAYNTVIGADEIAILQLGNQTKKKFTLSKVSAKDREEMLVEWNAIKELAYVKLKQENWIEPRVSPYPVIFKLNRI